MYCGTYQTWKKKNPEQVVAGYSFLSLSNQGFRTIETNTELAGQEKYCRGERMKRAVELRDLYKTDVVYIWREGNWSGGSYVEYFARLCDKNGKQLELG